LKKPGANAPGSQIATQKLSIAAQDTQLWESQREAIVSWIGTREALLWALNFRCSYGSPAKSNRDLCPANQIAKSACESPQNERGYRKHKIYSLAAEKNLLGTGRTLPLLGPLFRLRHVTLSAHLKAA
jgi:hypothetical protein